MGGANSGRRPRSEEEKLYALFLKSLKVTEDFILDETQPKKDRADAAMKIVVKYIPDQHKHSGSVEFTGFVAEMIKKAREIK